MRWARSTTSPKMCIRDRSKTVENEKDMLKVGYGAMILESLLAVLALCVAGAAADVYKRQDSTGCGDERRAAQKVDLCGLEKRFNAGGQLLRKMCIRDSFIIPVRC